MKTYQMKHGNDVVLKKVMVADNAFTRMMGLMFKESIEKDEGLLLVPGNTIHTFFMKFTLDAYFLDRSNKIVSVVRSLRPWKMTGIKWKASKVLEVKEGSLPQEIGVNDQLEFICTN